MDTNSWRPPQADAAVPADAGDWRSQLQPDSRQRIVNKIMETLKRHLPLSGQEGLQELRKIAMRFEEKIYTVATSQSDYLRRISLRMLTMESKSQNTLPNAAASNSTGRNPQDPASQNVQLQVQNQSQSLGQNSNLQAVSSISQNSVGNAMGQGASSSMFANGQRQMHGRHQAQQVGVQQQAQSSQQYVYQQQFPQQMLNQKLQQGNVQQSPLQPQIQQQQQQPQQNLLQQSQLQPSQSSVIQAQPASQSSVMQAQPAMQALMMSGLQQGQQSSVLQSSQPGIQQHQQSILRQQQQPQQTPAIHPLQTQSMISSQPQQHQQLVGQQSNTAAMQQNQLIGHQNGMSEMPLQQQRLMGQPTNFSNLPSQQQNSHSSLQQQQQMGKQNNLPNTHLQPLGPQNHVGGHAQQQQMLGAQSGNSTLQSNQPQVHIMPQSKLPVQQNSQNASGLLPDGVQQPQAQQQLISQIQPQALQLQQQSISMQQNIQQRLQPSNSLLQQNIIDQQQKQIYPFQRALTEAPSSSLDSTAQTGNQVDWQEEGHQKIKAMRDMYYNDLNELYQKIYLKLQQHDSQQPKTEQIDKLRTFKQMLETLLQFLQLTKNNIPSKEKVAQCEKQIIIFLNMNRPRKPPSLQQGQLPPHMQSMQQFQQSHPQIPQAQSHDSGMSPQLQTMNLQNSNTVQQSNLGSLQHRSVSSLTGIASSNLDSGQQNVPSSMQQVNMGSVQQIPISAPQQSNVNAVPLQSGAKLLQPNTNALQSNSNMLQNQHVKQHQEQQMMQSQQLKHRLQQRPIQQQLLQKQQLLQQQQLHQLSKQQQHQQHGQMQPHQMSQAQINDANDTKLRHGMALKPSVLPHHVPPGQKYPIQQVKPGGTFPNSSPQLLQTASPQTNQHSSPQIDQQSMLPTLTKVGTPLQSANSPFVVPSPPTPLAPSPMPGEPEKPNTGLSSLSNVASAGHQQLIAAPVPAPSLAIGTPGISASPLLAEVTGPDGTRGSASTVSGKPGVTEQPLERLLKAVSSLSSKEMNGTVTDIGSIVSMIDRIAGSAPGNGSRAAVGEDLVAMTKCRLQARNFVTRDGSSGTKRMRQYTVAVPLNVASSLSSINDSSKQFIASDTLELESTATSNIKRLKNEANHALFEEIRDINERLMDTVVEISNEDMNPTMAAAAADCGEGTMVKCSFTAVTLSPALKSQYVSQMSPIQPLKMLVPANYPNSSPILLDKFPLEASEYEDLSVKAKSRFRISLRTLSQPMSLADIARTWDDCTRAVLIEYAQQSGGGTFSTKFGLWEDCLTAA